MVDKIRNSYFLRELFNIIDERKALKILKYNKKLQKRLKLSIKDYIKFNNRIEMELEVFKYPQLPNYFFISKLVRLKKYDLKIYFNNEFIERGRSYFSQNENVTSIKIIITNKVNSLFNFFNYCTCIKKIKIMNYNGNNINNLSHLFENCSSLVKIDLSHFKTDNVTNMANMCSNCYSLTDINLNNFKTNKVTSMSSMFHNCSSLINLDLSSFDTSNVNNMYYMFYGCKNLTNIDISNFSVHRNIYDFYMFNIKNKAINIKTSNIKFIDN